MRLFNFEDGANNITLDHLTITGALDGVFATDESGGLGSRNETISNNVIFGNIEAGIRLGINDNGWLITGNSIHDNQGSGGFIQDGIYINDAFAAITNNSIFNQIITGILIQSTPSGSVISGNNVFENSIGINVTGAHRHRQSPSTTTPASASTHINSGINRDPETHCLASDSLQAAAGIELENGEVRGNAVYGKCTTASGPAASRASPMTTGSYSNTNIGIFVDVARAASDVFNNLVYDNSNGGIFVQNTFQGNLNHQQHRLSAGERRDPHHQFR